MTIHSLPNRKQTKHSASATAAGALLALVLAAGIGVWYLARDQASGRATTLATPGAEAPDATSAVIPSAVWNARPATVYFLVDSEEQASVEREQVAALNAWAGPLNAATLVAENEEAAAGIREAVAALATLRDTEGLPPIRLIDRRAGGAVARSPSGAAGGCGLDVQARAC